MKTFKQFVDLQEKQGHPTWVKGTSIFLTLKNRNLSSQIKQTTEIDKKIDLLSDQNKFLSYLVTLGIGVDTKDKSLMRRFGKRS